MNIIYKEKMDIFIKNYFKSLRIKSFLILALIWIIVTYLTKVKEDTLITIAVVIVVSLFAFFIVPDFLRKETEESVGKDYNKISKSDDKIVFICNSKKFNGPTFGTLHINKKLIEFNPFRENLQNERFLIQGTDMKNINISLFKIKSSLLNMIFFKELHKAIRISGDGIKVLLQTPEPEKTIEKIKKKICLS